MAREKKSAHKVAMTEGKHNIIQQHRDIGKEIYFDAQDADQELFAHMEFFGGVVYSIPGQITGKDGTFPVEDIRADYLLGNGKYYYSFACKGKCHKCIN